MSSYYVPQHLDEPFKLILWTVDEFLLFMTPMLILMFFFSSPIWGMVLGGLLMTGIRKIKGEQGHYFIKNLCYWYLPSWVFQCRATPPSYLRELIG